MIKKIAATAVFILLSVVTVSHLNAQDLNTLGEMATALKEDLGFDSSVVSANYSTARLYRLLNRSMNFVEVSTQCTEDRIRLVLTTGQYVYALGDSISYNGVLGAYRVSSGPRGLAIKATVDLGKAAVQGEDNVYGYELWDHSVVFTNSAAQTDTIYLNVFKETPQLDSANAVVRMPRKYRELVIQYAYYLCLRSEHRHDLAREAWSEYLQKLQLIREGDTKQAETIDPERH